MNCRCFSLVWRKTIGDSLLSADLILYRARSVILTCSLCNFNVLPWQATVSSTSRCTETTERKASGRLDRRSALGTVDEPSIWPRPLHQAPPPGPSHRCKPNRHRNGFAPKHSDRQVQINKKNNETSRGGTLRYCIKKEEL
jgi:hypothetical protein